MNRLSSAVTAMKAHYDVVVVGSGYGGAIAASRMARAGLSVCVLERGREFMAGEYPRTPFQGAEEVQYNTALAHVGSPLALLEVHVNDDVNAVVGCGLGGTSLINANVALEADPRLWDDPRWPKALRDDAAGREHGYALARAMLQPSPVPDSYPVLPKLQALEKSAQALGMADRFSRPPITVTFEDRVNAAGVEQKACVGCGDCNSGCNYDAKNSTHMNYLPDAVAHGAQIFTGAAVHSVLRDAATQQWTVRYQLVSLGRESYGAPDLFVSADLVIVSAGTIGSTALLLRSREAGLSVSAMLGEHFTGNGDVLSFAYNTDDIINGVGWGTHTPGQIPPVGPTITGLIDHRDTANVRDGFVIEEGSLAGPVGAALVGPARRRRAARRRGCWRRAERRATTRVRRPRARKLSARSVSWRAEPHAKLSRDGARRRKRSDSRRRQGPAAHRMEKRRQAADLCNGRANPRTGDGAARRQISAQSDFHRHRRQSHCHRASAWRLRHGRGRGARRGRSPGPRVQRRGGHGGARRPLCDGRRRHADLARRQSAADHFRAGRA
ncbi:ferredoxin [Paraburkholderia bryophila]|uniref:Ferredoxin n=1 Tax=Paraburkholderia bryophila TaxID=420952 RepID=A0A7Y9WAI9_9BURK|nr:ferredoxin [Paraburkholderia bryophila]